MRISSFRVSGGKNESAYSDDSIWKYHASNNTWETTELKLAAPVDDHAVTVIHDCPMSQSGNIMRGKRSAPAPDDGNKTLIYKAEHIEITTEGLLSLVLVQLPGISLGVFGIMKAFINHGMTSQAVKDSLRCLYNQLNHCSL